MAVVDQVFATKYLPNRNPIGQTFGLNDNAHSVTVVGVATNARYNSLTEEIPPVAYISYLQNADHHRTTDIIFRSAYAR